MELTFNQIEAIFVERFDISADRATAFRGRLQHLQRLNFPTGVNTGRGTKANYGWTQLIQLMVALDLIDLGMTPDVATKTVRQSTDRLLAAVHRVISEFENADALARAFKKVRCPFNFTQFAIVSALALTFRRDSAESALILTLNGQEFSQRLTDDPAVEPAAAFINLGSRLMLVAQLAGRYGSIDPLKLAQNLLDWAGRWAYEDSLS